MRVRQAVGALLQVLVVLLLFSLSGLLIFLEQFPLLRFQLADLLLNDPASFRLAGCVILFSAFVFFACWKSLDQKRVLHVKMGEAKITLGSRL